MPSASFAAGGEGAARHRGRLAVAACGRPYAAARCDRRSERRGRAHHQGRAKRAACSPDQANCRARPTLMLWSSNKDAPLSYVVNVSSPAAKSLLSPARRPGEGARRHRTDHGRRADGGSASPRSRRRRDRGTSARAGRRVAAIGTANGSKKQCKQRTKRQRKTAPQTARKSTTPRQSRPARSSRSTCAWWSSAARVLKQVGLNILKQNNGFTFGSFAPSALTSATYGSTPSFSAWSRRFRRRSISCSTSATHGLFADLSLMESNNLARILAEPTPVALSGQSASFLLPAAKFRCRFRKVSARRRSNTSRDGVGLHASRPPC